MKTYARIQDGVVAELFETDADINQLFHPDLVWKECGPGTQVGDVFEAGLFSRPAIPISRLRDAKAAELDGACAAEIISGFTSAALGTAHTYPSKPTDQANLVASVVDAIDNSATPGWVTPFWCADASGVWEWRNHTAEQIRQVGRDGKTCILAAQSRNAVLQAQVALASTPEAIAAINWA